MSGFMGLRSFSIISDQVCYIYEEIGLHMANILISNDTWVRSFSLGNSINFG